MSGVLAASKKEHWVEAVQWLFYVTTIGALPFWGVALMFWLFQRQIRPELFIRNAELAVYSAGLLASAMPILTKEIKDSPFKQPRWFFGIAVVVLVAAGLVFASVTLADELAASATNALSGIAVKGGRLLAVSIVLTLGAVLICFFTELVNNVRLDVNYQGLRHKDVDDLAARVTKKLEDEPDA